MIRLAYLCADPGVPIGGTKGAAVHVSEIVRALRSEGADVLLLASSSDPGAGLERAAVETLPGPGRGAAVRDRLGAEPRLADWLTARLRDFGAQALVERLALHTAAGSRAAPALGIPHLVEMNAPLLEEATAYRRLDEPEAARLAEGATLAGADRVFAVSRPLASYASRRGARAVEVLPNAVRIERFRAVARPAEGEPVAVLTGTLRPWHGVETLAAAWRLLGEEAPHLVVVGDGPGRERLEAAGAEVTGSLHPDRVPALLAGADIGLAPYAPGAPSYFSPLKLFEYMAAGLAIVAGELPGVSDAVGEGEALLVPPGDPERLAEAVAALVGDPLRRARLGRGARARAQAEHTWAQRARRILDSARSAAPEAAASA